MSNPVIFRELPETFPEKDAYKKTSLATSLAMHTALVAGLLVIPFFILDEIPQLELLTELVAPPPPPPAASPAPVQIVGVAKPSIPPVVMAKPVADALIMPTAIPPEIARVVEGPDVFEGVIGGVVGGVPGGVAGGVLGSMLARNAMVAERPPLPMPAPPPPPPPPAPAAWREPYRVGGDVKEPRIVSLVQPRYPSTALRARVQGTVVLEATLNENGTVDAIKVVSGHPFLLNAAIDAVKQWRYEPTLLNGHPVAVVLTAIVTFQMPPVSE
jgi:periplasmic protein TonB